jgi:hypothetical protein
MKNLTRVAGVVVGALLLPATVRSADAQGAPAAAQPAAAQPGAASQPGDVPRAGEPSRPGALGDVELVSEREIFHYPSYQRRNPFRPLLGDESGPRFEQVELRGINYDRANGDRSVAILGLRAQAERQIQQIVQRQVAANESTTAPRQDTIYVPEPTERLRVGQSWGNMRVARIEADHVVLNVTEFGITEQRILRIVVRRQGGPS